VRLEGLGQLKKVHLIGNLTRDLPACSIVPEPTTLPRAPILLYMQENYFDTSCIQFQNVLPHKYYVSALFSHSHSTSIIDSRKLTKLKGVCSTI
jgi:hypothetical protein